MGDLLPYEIMRSVEPLVSGEAGDGGVCSWKLSVSKSEDDSGEEEAI